MVATVLVVAYAVVPGVAHFVDALGGYNPQSYEPKDFARENWLDAQGRLIGLSYVPLKLVVNVLLFLLVAILWLAVSPSRRR